METLPREFQNLVFVFPFRRVGSFTFLRYYFVCCAGDETYKVRMRSAAELKHLPTTPSCSQLFLVVAGGVIPSPLRAAFHITPHYYGSFSAVVSPDSAMSDLDFVEVNPHSRGRRWDRACPCGWGNGA